ncbi:MAG: hypothetical protein RMJ89_04765, partial [Flammeovirgaceae bacterium]|nr:hypothetical protein [Flammeovirgaceae bacterium]
MTTFQKIGLMVFIIGFGLFNLVFWGVEFQLSQETLAKAIPDEKHRAKIWQHASEMKNKTYESSFGFVSDLSEVFEKVNQQAIHTFGISEVEIGILLAMSERGKTFRLETKSIEHLFGGKNEISTFKREAFKNFGNWIIGKEFSTKKELQKAL